MSTERIDILVVMKDLLSRPAKRVEDSLDDVGDAAEDAAKDLDQYDASQRRAARGATAAERELRKLAAAQRRAQQNTEQITTRWDRFAMSVRRGGKSIRNTWNHLNNMFHKFFTTWSLIQGLFTDMAAMIPVLATGLKSLSAMVIALIGPLVKMTGVAGQVVPAYLAFAQAATTLTMGLRGVGGAVRALRSGDLAAIEASFMTLGPNAQAFAVALVPIADRLQRIQRRVQETFLQGMDEPVTRLADRYLPRLNKGLWRTAHAARRGFSYFVDVMSQPSNMKLFSRVMRHGAVSTEKMGRVGTQFGISIMKVADAAAPSLNRTLDSIGDKLAAWNTNKSQKSLRRFFNEAQESAVKFGQGLRHLFRGLGGVGRAARPLSEFLTSGMMSGLEKFDKWANSEEGQAKMTKFFEDQIPNLQAIGELFRVIRDEFGGQGDVRNKNFLNFIEVAKDDIVPAIADIFEALDKHVTPSMINLAQNSGIIDWEMAFKPLGQALDIASEVATWLTETMDKFPPLRDIKSYLFGLQMIGAIPLALGITRGVARVAKKGVRGIFGGGGKGSSPLDPQYVFVTNPGFGGTGGVPGKGGKPASIAAKAAPLAAAGAGALGILAAIAAPIALMTLPKHLKATGYKADFNRGFRPQSPEAQAMRTEGAQYRESKGIPSPAEARQSGMSAIEYQQRYGAKITPTVSPTNTVTRQLGTPPAGREAWTSAFGSTPSSMPVPFVKEYTSTIDKFLANHKSEVKVGANTTPAQQQIDKLITTNQMREVTINVKTPLSPTATPPLSSLIPGYADGGYVPSGTTAIVGERGAEAFVSQSGRAYLVGQGGPEIRKFGEGGYVIPNEALKASQGRGYPTGTPEAFSGVYGAPGGLHLHFGGTNASPKDIERAVALGIARAEREARERS